MELTQDQKFKVIQLIKIHIKEEGNCRVGWAIKIVTGEKFEHSIHNIEKIANTLIQSGKYLKEISKQKENDYNIFKNPQYKLRRFNIITVIINIILTIIIILTAIFELLE